MLVLFRATVLNLIELTLLVLQKVSSRGKLLILPATERDKQVLPAIVVIIDKFHPPTALSKASTTAHSSCAEAYVNEGSVSLPTK